MRQKTFAILTTGHKHQHTAWLHRHLAKLIRRRTARLIATRQPHNTTHVSYTNTVVFISICLHWTEESRVDQRSNDQRGLRRHHAFEPRA